MRRNELMEAVHSGGKRSARELLTCLKNSQETQVVEHSEPRTSC
jgi:hypothetical protein